MDEGFEALTKFCKGDSLSLPLLRQKLEASPEGTIRANLDNRNDDTTLLHYVCCNKRVTLEIVEYLVSLYPEAVEIRTDYGWHPLHRACLNEDCPNDVVEYLVKLYPDALSVPWPHRGLPLHCLVSRRTKENLDDLESCYQLDLNLVRLLVHAYPEALTNQDNNSASTPLLLACERDDVSIDLVRLLVDKEYAVLCLRKRYRNKLPIENIFEKYRVSATWRVPFEVVKFFAESAPDTLTSSTLHSVCRSRYVSLEAAELIVESRRDINLLEQSNDIGNLPLHSLCLSESRNDPTSSLLPIIKYVVRKYPEAVRAVNDYGFLPLTYALRATLDITRFFVEEYPDSVYEADSEGHLPFHTACTCSSIETVKYLFARNPGAISTARPVLHLPSEYNRDVLPKIKFLLEKDPQSVKRKDLRNGNLPLHAACAASTSELAVIKTLFEAYPEAIATRNNSGFLPLHCFLATDRHFSNECDERRSKETITTIDFLVTEFPSSVRAADSEGRLPLHHASKHYPLFIVLHLAQKYLEGVHLESPEHGLPLHCACSQRHKEEGLPVAAYLLSLYPESVGVRNESVGIPLECAECKEIFEFLLQRRYRDMHTFPLHAVLEDKEIMNPSSATMKFLSFFPGNAKQIDNYGRYPLHLAVSSPKAALSVVEELIELHGEAVEHQDKQGLLPLHLFLRHSASMEIEPCMEIVEALLSEYSNGSKVPDCIGRLPLHFACRYGSPSRVLARILGIFPAAVRAEDHNGCLPLHVACRHGLLEIKDVKSLLSADATMAQASDKSLELPLHKACRGGHIDIVNFLLEAYAPASGMRTASASLPIYLLCQKSGKVNPAIMETPGFTETVWRLLRAHPEAVKDAM